MFRPRLLFLVTEDWYFVLHRLPMARAAQRAGYEVHVATRIRDHGPAIEAEGFALHPIAFRRGSIAPADFLSTAWQARQLYRALRPAVVHHVSLQPTVVGSLAALGLPIRRLNGLTGLGYVFSANTAKARLSRAILKRLMPWLLNRPSTLVTVENPDDRQRLVGFGLAAEQVVVLPGSGVDVVSLTVLPEPEGPVTAAFVGRMVDSKGVRTLVAAHGLLASRGSPIRLLLAGALDPANPGALSRDEIEGWTRRPGLQWLGHVNDVRTVWAQAHIAVLPSRGGEGVPMSLGEAAACGRPLIATDVPGCREIAQHDVNAILVPPDDPAALAGALERLAGDPALRARLGAAGRWLVESKFSSRHVEHEIVALYNRLVGSGEAVDAASRAAAEVPPSAR